MQLAVAAALVAAVAGGCTSSGATKESSSPTSTQPAPATSSSAAPSTSTTPRPKPTPLSPFEADPAVQAMRKFFYVGARTVNEGHYTSPALHALITSVLAREIKQVFGPDVGGYYPGPVPFQPVGVTVISSTRRDIRGCLLANGWAQNRKTHEPLRAYQVIGARTQANKVSGRWLMGALPADKNIRCSNVKVQTQRW